MTRHAMESARLSLKDQVDGVLPGWESWYPTLFDAACDLGLLRARVCAPSSLLLSNRHAAVHGEAMQAFRERWAIDEEPDSTSLKKSLPDKRSRSLRSRVPADVQLDILLDIDEGEPT